MLYQVAGLYAVSIHGRYSEMSGSKAALAMAPCYRDLTPEYLLRSFNKLNLS